MQLRAQPYIYVANSAEATLSEIAPNQTSSLQLGISGASPGQTIDLTINLHGPLNEHGVYTWCCTALIRVVYPTVPCGWIDVGGDVYHDLNANGRRDPNESGAEGWTVVPQPAAGEARTTTTDARGAFRFAGVPPGVYRASLRPKPRWCAGVVHEVRVGAGAVEPLQFGVTQQR